MAMPSSNSIALGSAILTPFLWVLHTFWQNKSHFVLKNLFSASQPFSSASCLPQEKTSAGERSGRLQQQLPAKGIWFRDPYQRGPGSWCQTQNTPGRHLRDALRGLLENLKRGRCLLPQTQEFPSPSVGTQQNREISPIVSLYYHKISDAPGSPRKMIWAPKIGHRETWNFLFKKFNI